MRDSQLWLLITAIFAAPVMPEWMAALVGALALWLHIMMERDER